jgi:hypothetical protein
MLFGMPGRGQWLLAALASGARSSSRDGVVSGSGRWCWVCHAGIGTLMRL